MTRINRREALCAAFAGAGALLAANPSRAAALALPNPDDPAMLDGVEAWKYVEIDPQSVANQAYDDYHIGHCMHTVFKSIVDHVAAALEKSDPLAARTMRAFPFHMFHYGASGETESDRSAGRSTARWRRSIFLSRTRRRARRFQPT